MSIASPFARTGPAVRRRFGIRGVTMVLVVGTFLVAGGACTSSSDAGADADSETTVSFAKRERLPAGWPEILVLEPDAVVVEMLDSSGNGEFHQAVIAEQDGIPQNVFSRYKRALTSDGWDIVSSHEWQKKDGSLERRLKVFKADHWVSVQVWGERSGLVRVRLTHNFDPGPDGSPQKP